MAYEVADNMLIRLGIAKVMSRPLLGNLAPSVTAFTVPNALARPRAAPSPSATRSWPRSRRPTTTSASSGISA
jgi:hypothetical protein